MGIEKFERKIIFIKIILNFDFEVTSLNST